ncbi:MAG: hypothetical protein JWN30_128 [Bacilli bacterium]|nr:hypothetical protein [Bacilli bacterium]
MPCEELVQQAYNLILQNDFLSAIAAFKKALSLCPQEADLYYRLSITYARSHMLEEAEKAAGWAVHLDPASTDYIAQLRHIQAMRIHLESIKLSKTPSALSLAEKLLKQSIELDPVYIQAYVDLGNVYRDMGDYQSAMQTYQMALELVPEHLEAKLRMTEIRPLVDRVDN